MTDDRHIIVGFDGSTSSELALSWAVDEAVRRGTSLRLLYAIPAAGTGTWGVAGRLYGRHLGDVEKQGIELLERGERRARARAEMLGHSGLQVEGECVLDSPAHALLEWGAAAEQVVVGARGLSPAARVLLGSVSRHTVTSAQVPVVVVRDRPGGPVESGPVVVGLDGSPASSAALAYAVEAALSRRRPLLAVHAWLLDDPSLTDRDKGDGSIEKEREALRTLLADETRPLLVEHPELEVTHRVVPGHPVDELLELSRTAGLVVLGSHGRNLLARAVLGSVSSAVVARAECPVAILRPGSWAPARR